MIYGYGLSAFGYDLGDDDRMVRFVERFICAANSARKIKSPQRKNEATIYPIFGLLNNFLDLENNFHVPRNFFENHF